MFICKICNKEFKCNKASETRIPKYCSRICYSKRVITDETRSKMSKAKIGVKIKPVKKEVFAGAIYYRAIGSSKRVSRKQLRKKEDIVRDYILQEYCPF